MNARSMLCAALCVGALSLIGCEEKKAEAPPQAQPPAAPEQKVHGAEPIPPSTADAGAPSAAPSEEAATPTGPLTPGALQSGFKADRSKWLGKKIAVDGLYMNTNTARTGGTTTVNVVVVQEKGKFDPSVTCYLSNAEAPKGLTQYDPVRIEGTVREGFGAQLEDCSVTKR